MAFTQLSPTATPGRRYSFAPKAEAVPEAGPHTGTFTALSVIGLPGQIHSFTAKTAAEGGTGTHTGAFTALSVLGLPGGIRVFLPKTAVVETGGVGRGGNRRSFAGQEDDEFMQLLILMAPILLN